MGKDWGKNHGNKAHFLVGDHPGRMKRHIKYSISGWMNLILHDHQPLVLREISISQMSAGNSAQQGEGRQEAAGKCEGKLSDTDGK